MKRRTTAVLGLPPEGMHRFVRKAGRGAWGVGLSAALAVAFMACNPIGAHQADKQSEQGREHPVVVARLASRRMVAAIRSAGTIEAEREVKLPAQSSGVLANLSVEEGDAVRKGQVLARVKRDAQASSVRRAQTNLSQARRELARVQALAKRGVVGRQELDQAKDRVKLARMDAGDRGRDLANTKIQAPMAGIVTRRLVQPGAFVGAGAPVLTITDFATLVARVHVPERELDRIAVGQPVTVVGKAAKGRRAKGSVLRISPIVDPKTGTVKVTVGLKAQSLERARDFRPGMYAEVIIQTQARNGVQALPKSAVLHEEGRTSVMLSVQGRAKRVPVELGQSDTEWVEVVKGISPQDEVIVAGQQTIKSGAKVKVVPASSQPGIRPVQGQERPGLKRSALHPEGGRQ